MGDFVAFFIAGLGLGAVYALLGLGVMLLYRSTGVLNFAIAAMGMVGVYCYVSLTEWGVNPAVAAAIVLIGAAPVGIVLELLVMWRFRQAPVTTKAVATIAMLVGFIGITDLVWGTFPRAVPSFLPSWNATIADVLLPAERIATLVVVGVALVVLGLLFTHTRAGVAMRAMANDRDTARLVGIPVARLTAFAWAGTAVVAVLSIILVAPSAGLSSRGLSLFVIPGLAAAVIGGLRRPTQTVLGGLLLGVIESEAGLEAWTSEHSRLVPFAVLLVVLLWHQRRVLIPALSEEGTRT